MKKLVAVPALLLAGCVSMDGGIPSPTQLSDALNAAYRDRPVSEVIARYGAPESQFTTDSGIRVLVWSTDSTMRFHEDVSTTTSGSVGDPGAYPYLAAVPYRETTTSRQGYNVDMACKLQVGVFGDGTVHGLDVVGKMGACQNFMPY